MLIGFNFLQYSADQDEGNMCERITERLVENYQYTGILLLLHCDRDGCHLPLQNDTRFCVNAVFGTAYPSMQL